MVEFDNTEIAFIKKKFDKCKYCILVLNDGKKYSFDKENWNMIPSNNHFRFTNVQISQEDKQKSIRLTLIPFDSISYLEFIIYEKNG